MRIAIVVERVPPYCGGGEQVAWVHALELSKRHEVAIVTFGDGDEVRDGLPLLRVPESRRNLLTYSTLGRRPIRERLEHFSPAIIHCHMPHILSACLPKRDSVFISTIHDGVPENEMRSLKRMSAARFARFKLLRIANILKSDAVTCVSRHNYSVMAALYPRQRHKFSVIPNPIGEQFFRTPGSNNEGYVLNFGRQISLKMGALLDVAKLMPQTRFVFAGSGDMVNSQQLPNIEFVGFSSSVMDYIDKALLCVFPSLSENMPLVGLEAMARGKVVIATRRGFSEYITHMKNGILLESVDPAHIRDAINLVLTEDDLRRGLEQEARQTAERYRPAAIVGEYEALYWNLLEERRSEPPQRMASS